MKRLDNAFIELISLIIHYRWEFPRAHEHCCLAFALTDTQAIKLTKMYDDYCIGG